MPTDSSTQTVEVKAPLADVLALIRDVGGQATWIPEVREVEVLEVYEEDDLPATARIKASAPVGTDEYTLSFEHNPTGMTWSMLSGRLQTGQEGTISLEELTPDRTAVTYELTIHHNLPIPGILRRRVIKGLVANTLDGLKERMEA